jgi:hypothetical protein
MAFIPVPLVARKLLTDERHPAVQAHPQSTVRQTLGTNKPINVGDRKI